MTKKVINLSPKDFSSANASNIRNAFAKHKALQKAKKDNKITLKQRNKEFDLVSERRRQIRGY